MATTTELLQKQINEIEALRALPSSKHPSFEKWHQITKTILEKRLGEKRAQNFPSGFDYWPNHMGPWYDDELKESLLEGLASAEAYLSGIIEEIDLLGEEQVPINDSQKSNPKTQRFGDITVSGGTLVLGDGNRITQVAVKELVEALKNEIKEKVPESEEKMSVLSSLKSITTNETFAAVAGTPIGEILRRVTRP